MGTSGMDIEQSKVVVDEFCSPSFIAKMQKGELGEDYLSRAAGRIGPKRLQKQKETERKREKVKNNIKIKQ